ncbi:MAG TPA: protein-glutamate O-methyltransferase CheR [Bacteroidales bacterium]|nr:protein-glutamate O-methyltransferase CheR [Bacteroidales bacterium]
MQANDLHKLYQAELSDSDFERLSEFIFREYGIHLPPHKKLMLQSRLRSRLKINGCFDFATYIAYLFSSRGQQVELIHMIDAVTTNKTDFFREPDHFDFLYRNVFIDHYQHSTNRSFKIWSAGCSTGEEAYTMAIILSEFKASHHQFEFEIVATDVSATALRQATTAIYPESKTQVIPLSLRKNYLLRSCDRTAKTVRIVSALRQKVHFERQNLMHTDKFHESDFDVIFCRNTLIYFDRVVQLRVVRALLDKLRKGGYFFIGHSESLFSDLWLPLKRVAPAVYQKI